VLPAGVDEQPLILVVEDDEATRSFLLDNLAADGFRVAGASGAGEALRAIEVRQPRLVVLDLALDDGSGLTLLDRLRAAEGLASRIDPELPVIVLTGRAGDADRVRSFARGADDHLSKPTCRFPQRVIPGRAPGSVIWSGALQWKCARCVRQEDTATSEGHADGLGCGHDPPKQWTHNASVGASIPPRPLKGSPLPERVAALLGHIQPLPWGHLWDTRGS
jgi:CheY-like chemotaxis protein